MRLFDLFKKIFKKTSSSKKKGERSTHGHLPSIERQYECVRIIADCYQIGKFDELYPLFTDNVKWFSQWQNGDIIGKNNVIESYKRQEKTIIDKDYYCVTQIVQLIGNMNKDSKIIGTPRSDGRPEKVILVYEDGKLCIFVSQYIKGEQVNSMIVPEYCGDKISEIGICNVEFYKFHSYWPGNGEKVDWGKGIPKYKKKDTLRDEELCDFACNIVHDYFIKKEGYQILFASNLLSAFPNFALKKDGKTILLIVRGGEVHNMPTLNKKEEKLFLTLAKREGQEIYFAPVGFGACDPIRFDEKLLLRGDGFYANFTGITPIVSK